MAASSTLALSSPHNDLITSLIFSPQSTHLATSSLDSQIRIVQRNPATQVYDHNPVIWKAHDGPVLCLSFSPPQLGLILASGGVDGTIKIWRQPDQSTLHKNTSSARPLNPHSSVRHSTLQNWIPTSTLTEPRGTVRSLGFSRSEFGLKLAAIASDGKLRVWECLDPIKANEFTLVQDIDLNSLPSHPSTASSGTSGNVSSGFSNASSTTPGTAIGGGNISESSTGTTSGVSSNVTGTSSSVTSSSIDGRRVGGQSGGTVESDGGWSLSWCREHWWGERLAVSSGVHGIIRLFHFPSHGPPSNFLNLYPTRQTLSSLSSDSNPPPPSHLPPTSSLNWAPPSGRSFQLLAAGSKDSKVRVYKIFPPTLQGPGTGITPQEGGEWAAQLDVELDESIHSRKSGVVTSSGSSTGIAPSNSTAFGGIGVGGGGIGATKVEWNVTGTVLSTSGGEDGMVRLWKSTYTGQWRQITSLKTETPAAGEGLTIDQ
ncbi:uncharacterized protein JCM6883_003044 [Sporobolomyces salmoneus]|uniref:uncharacterized protein n=1 Tax=Sporobolomyces salmoneus TaxID=183962 RepID=UPI00316DB326